jgi:hypothetical protein
MISNSASSEVLAITSSRYARRDVARLRMATMSLGNHLPDGLDSALFRGALEYCRSSEASIRISPTAAYMRCQRCFLHNHCMAARARRTDITFAPVYVGDLETA